MTIGEYISQKLQAFGVSEAYYMDVANNLGMSLDERYTSENASAVGKAMVSVVEELILAPRLSNVNEGGFSMSWDFENIAKYYVYLCKKWGVSMNEDILTSAGISAIIDRSNMW